MSRCAQITEAIGRRVIADFVGVVPSAVDNAISRGFFPPSWFPRVAFLCARAGVDCSAGAFRWSRDDHDTEIFESLQVIFVTHGGDAISPLLVS